MQNKTFLFLLFCFSLVVRFVFFNTFLRDNPVQLAFDSGHYHSVAVNVAHGKGFTSADGSPHFYRMPGYPLFLACCYLFCDDNPHCALYIQLILASLIPLLLFLLSSLLLPQSRMVAIASSLIVAVHPGFLIMSGLLMSETLFVALLALFLLFLLLSVRRQRQLYFVISGLFLGMASLVRPIGIEVLVVVFVIMWLLQATLKNVIAISSAWFAVVGMWMIRNFMWTGFFFLHTFVGPHLLNHGAARVLMMAEQTSYQQAKEAVLTRYKQDLELAQQYQSWPLQEIEQSRVAKELAIQICWQHPWQTFQLGMINMFKTLFSLYSSELLFIDSGGQLPPYDLGRGVSSMIMRFIRPRVHNSLIAWVIYYEIILHFFILLGAAIWLFSGRGCACQQALAFSLPFMFLFIFLSSVCGFARLRLPIEPFLIMLAMSFWMALMTRKRVG